MIKNVLTSIGGVGVYGVISICIFIAVFLAALGWMFCLKKPYLERMQALPLEDDRTATPEPSSPNSEVLHE